MPRWLYWIAAAAMIALYLLVSVRKTADSRPVGSVAELAELAQRDDLNVIFILVDTLRAGRLGAYGYERDTSPRLDELAATGVLFRAHESQSSWTKASMASLWTALYPARTRVLRYDDAVSSEARMPAEILRDAGYRTNAVWRNGWVAPNFGFSQGFEAYHRPNPMPIPPSVRRENPSLKNEGTDQEIILSAREFLRTYGDSRFFLYLHLMDVHQYVYDEDSALFGTTYSDIYDNAIRRTDNSLGVLLDTLEARALRDKTLLIVASDHGEAFGEHGHEGHAKDLYSEVTHTPWILSLPFRLEPGVVVETPTENVDIWPTVLELLGLEPMGEVDGRSRVADIVASARGASPNGERPRYAQLDRHWGQTRKQPKPIVSVTEGDYRLFYHAVEPESPELYDLSADPGEQKNLADQQPDLSARLRERAEAYLDGPPPPWGDTDTKVEVDDMQLRQLRALGYKVD